MKHTEIMKNSKSSKKSKLSISLHFKNYFVSLYSYHYICRNPVSIIAVNLLSVVAANLLLRDIFSLPCQEITRTDLMSARSFRKGIKLPTQGAGRRRIRYARSTASALLGRKRKIIEHEAPFNNLSQAGR